MKTRVVSQQSLLSRSLPLLPIVAAQQSVLFPLYFFVPLWISLLSIGCAIIKIWETRSRKFAVIRWIKVVITLGAIGGILFTFHRFSGRDAGVALICVMYGLKILETDRSRDANLLLSLGFFMLVAGFLFTQKPWIAFYQFIPLIAILNALVIMHSVEPENKAHLSLGRVITDFSRYLLLALPVMLVLFVFFPRLSGPIWRMPGTTTASSGVSDSMSPGAISNLQLFDKVAFRVQFDGKEPDMTQMYWRVLVLDEFDGFTWTRGGARAISDPGVADVSLENIQYSVTLEQTRQNFLVALDKPIKTPKKGQLLRDFSVYSPFRILDRIRYSAVSSSGFVLDPVLSEADKKRYTTIPDVGNSRSRSWALQQRQLVDSEQDYINQVLTRINSQEYFYTLTPPIMEKDTVDSFWFDYQRGFCEHYAGALVYLARAANIPARVVVGYQGGEKNPLSDYWIIRYADAHAWTEIWIEGQGWLRIDPTSAIAAHRVEAQLLSDYHQRDSLFDEFDFVEMDDIGLYKQFEYWMDQFDSRWNDWILDYNNQVQKKLFEKWGFSGITTQQMVIFMFVLVAAFMLFSSVKWFHQRERDDPVAKAFISLQKKLDKNHVVRFDPTMGPQDLKRLLSRRKVVDKALLQIVDDYIRLRYQLEYPEKKQLKAFTNKLKRLKLVKKQPEA